MNFGTAQNDWIFKNERNGVRVYYKKNFGCLRSQNDYLRKIYHRWIDQVVV